MERKSGEVGGASTGGGACILGGKARWEITASKELLGSSPGSREYPVPVIPNR